MLLAYLDDSGKHKKGTDELLRYALGGCIATFEVWQEFNAAWQACLTAPGHPTAPTHFHYTDWKRAHMGYAKPRHQFYGWTQDELDILLSQLVAITAQRELHYICVSVDADKGKRPVRNSYAKACKYLIDRTRNVVNWIGADDKISFIITTQPELSDKRIEDYWNILAKAHPNMGVCVISRPEGKPGLQIADLVANEMSDSRRMRAGFGDGPFKEQILTPTMSCLLREPPFHHMVEYHVNDDV